MDNTLKQIKKDWDLYYESYAELNPDLKNHSIVTKRALLNHYVTHGYNEGRKIHSKGITCSGMGTNEQITTCNVFVLTPSMLVEK
mgnify:CR=1 FL=1|jgi:hypothetical protein